MRRSWRKVTGHIGSRKSSSKASQHSVPPYESCHPTIGSPRLQNDQGIAGGVRLIPIESLSNLPPKSDSHISLKSDDTFVFPPPPDFENCTSEPHRQKPELLVRTKSTDSDLHGNSLNAPQQRPTHLSTTPGPGFGSYRQKINFNEDSPSLSQLSLGSDDQTPDSPPPSFRPPTPNRASAASHRSITNGETKSDKKGKISSPILLHSGGVEPLGSFHRHKSEEKSNKPSIVTLAPFAAARKSLKKRKESKITSPIDPEPEDFFSLHRKAQTSLKMAINDKVSILHKTVFLA